MQNRLQYFQVILLLYLVLANYDAFYVTSDYICDSDPELSFLRYLV